MSKKSGKQRGEDQTPDGWMNEIKAVEVRSLQEEDWQHKTEMLETFSAC